MSATITRVTDSYGIDSGYFDVSGTWWDTRPETRRALLEAMGVDPEAPGQPADAPVEVVRPGRPSRLHGPGDLVLEDGTTSTVDGPLPADIPFGYHEWRPRDGAPVRLIAAPGRCPLDAGLRSWGWAAQLYSVRSRRSWGIGDLADLRDLAEWSRDLGAGLILINPISAVLPLEQQEASPYYPSSRRFRNPLYICVEEVRGAGGSREVEAAAAAGRALNQDRQIDRAAVFRLKMQALERLFERFAGAPAFDRYCAEQGAPLAEFATFCVLAEVHRAGWPAWPEPYRRPHSEAVRRFAADHAGRVRFHQWLQWLLDEQLRRASAGVRVMHDLPIGVDPGGADAWAWQDVLARGVRVGAPPDKFATQGQDWGLPPFVPHKLREAAYDPFVQVIRACLRHAGGLRIDHVMGLFRLFWIPQGASPREGTYVRYRPDELLAIVALESHRAGAIVCGEDLGTVEDGVRETLADQHILSYRVLWFESQPPATYPRLALSAVTTHDLPTIAGLWTGSDLEEQKRLDTEPNEEGTREIRDQVQRLTGLPHDADPADVVLALHRLLGEAPSVLVTATLEDALVVPDRPNMPGTSGNRPNWSLALPATLEEMRRQPLIARIAEILGAR